MDRRVFTLGIAMLAVGLASWAYFNSNIPVAKQGDMTDAEKNALLGDQAINAGIQNISGLVAGLGFFITLISIGLKRRNKGGVGKPITQKPAET